MKSILEYYTPIEINLCLRRVDSALYTPYSADNTYQRSADSRAPKFLPFSLHITDPHPFALHPNQSCLQSGAIWN